MKKWLYLSLTLLAAACGETAPPPVQPPAKSEAPTPPPAPTPEAKTPAPAPDEKAAASPAPAPGGPPPTRAWMNIVDLEGKPLAGMAPIVTRQPNAFDEPVATSGLTGADGKAFLEFFAHDHLYLRAWDPEMNWFPNNYFDVLPNEGKQLTDLKVVMVPAVALEAKMVAIEGTPLVNVRVRMMMILPSRGPWWPSEAVTDADGMAYFSHLPAGIYSLAFTSDAGQASVDQVSFTPKQTVDLGLLTLRP